MSKQKLPAELKRRYATRYYHTKEAALTNIATQGAASTEQGAIRAAVVRIFLGQHGKCVVIDRTTGEQMYQLFRGAGGLQAKYGSGVPYKEWKEPTK